jgi:hypothetical protein
LIETQVQGIVFETSFILIRQNLKPPQKPLKRCQTQLLARQRSSAGVRYRCDQLTAEYASQTQFFDSRPERRRRPTGGSRRQRQLLSAAHRPRAQYSDLRQTTSAIPLSRRPFLTTSSSPKTASETSEKVSDAIIGARQRSSAGVRYRCDQLTAEYATQTQFFNRGQLNEGVDYRWF